MAKKSNLKPQVLLELLAGTMLISATKQLNGAGVVNWLSSLSGIVGFVVIIVAITDLVRARKH